MTIWIVTWSYDWNEAAKAFQSREEAIAFISGESMFDLVGYNKSLPVGERFDLDDETDFWEAFLEVYESDDWKAFGFYELDPETCEMKEAGG